MGEFTFEKIPFIDLIISGNPEKTTMILQPRKCLGQPWKCQNSAVAAFEKSCSMQFCSLNILPMFKVFVIKCMLWRDNVKLTENEND